MKIYTEITWSMVTGETLSETSMEYYGPVALCYTEGSESKSYSDTVDEAYNARMAAIAERQQEMAEAYYDYWQKGAGGEASFQQVEGAQNTATLGLLPYQVALEKSLLSADQSLVGVETDAQRAAAEQSTARSEALTGLTPQATGIAQKYMTEALNRAKDPTREMDKAQAGVMQSFGKAGQDLSRTLSLSNVDPSSGKGLSARRNLLLDRAKAVSGARQNAYNQTFKDLENASRTGLAILN